MNSDGDQLDKPEGNENKENVDKTAVVRKDKRFSVGSPSVILSPASKFIHKKARLSEPLSSKPSQGGTSLNKTMFDLRFAAADVSVSSASFSEFSRLQKIDEGELPPPEHRNEESSLSVPGENRTMSSTAGEATLAILFNESNLLATIEESPKKGTTTEKSDTSELGDVGDGAVEEVFEEVADVTASAGDALEFVLQAVTTQTLPIGHDECDYRGNVESEILTEKISIEIVKSDAASNQGDVSSNVDDAELLFKCPMNPYEDSQTVGEVVAESSVCLETIIAEVENFEGDYDSKTIIPAESTSPTTPTESRIPDAAVSASFSSLSVAGIADDLEKKKGEVRLSKFDPPDTPTGLAHFTKERIDEYSFLINEKFCDTGEMCHTCYRMRVESEKLAEKFATLSTERDSAETANEALEKERAKSEELTMHVTSLKSELDAIKTEKAALVDKNEKLLERVKKSEEAETHAMKDLDDYKFFIEGTVTKLQSDNRNLRRQLSEKEEEWQISTDQQMKDELEKKQAKEECDKAKQALDTYAEEKKRSESLIAALKDDLASSCIELGQVRGSLEDLQESHAILTNQNELFLERAEAAETELQTVRKELEMEREKVATDAKELQELRAEISNAKSMYEKLTEEKRAVDAKCDVLAHRLIDSEEKLQTQLVDAARDIENMRAKADEKIDYWQKKAEENGVAFANEHITELKTFIAEQFKNSEKSTFEIESLKKELEDLRSASEPMKEELRKLVQLKLEQEKVVSELSAKAEQLKIVNGELEEAHEKEKKKSTCTLQQMEKMRLEHETVLQGIATERRAAECEHEKTVSELTSKVEELKETNSVLIACHDNERAKCAQLQEEIERMRADHEANLEEIATARRIAENKLKAALEQLAIEDEKYRKALEESNLQRASLASLESEYKAKLAAKEEDEASKELALAEGNKRLGAALDRVKELEAEISKSREAEGVVSLTHRVDFLESERERLLKACDDADDKEAELLQETYDLRMHIAELIAEKEGISVAEARRRRGILDCGPVEEVGRVSVKEVVSVKQVVASVVARPSSRADVEMVEEINAVASDQAMMYQKRSYATTPKQKTAQDMLNVSDSSGGTASPSGKTPKKAAKKPKNTHSNSSCQQS